VVIYFGDISPAGLKRRGIPLIEKNYKIYNISYNIHIFEDIKIILQDCTAMHK
jgi:hypothetical protein